MYKVIKIGYTIPVIRKSWITYASHYWRKWRTIFSPGTCFYCASMNGRILPIDDYRWDNIPVHPNCRCRKEIVTTIAAGTATEKGMDGVDRYVLLFGVLPAHYVTKQEAKAAGWKPILGNLDEVLPGKMIGGNIYKNFDHRLPETEGRIWYEADVNYDGGYRNFCRLLYSNDGLVFITYDHYLTFYEINLEVLG